MRHVLAALVAATVLVAPTPSDAQTFTPAPGLGAIALDLDTQDGTFSQWQVSDLCGVNAMRATVAAPRLGVHQRWAPAISLQVDTGTDRAFLQFTAREREYPLQAQVFRSEDGGRSQEATLPISLAADAAIDAAFEWTPDGRVTITAGGVQREIQLSGIPTRFAITNSTGEARIDPLRLGYVGAQPGCPLAD